MKLKYYLRGLGIGIITTTIIMLITFSGSKSTLSDSQIIERAKVLGMVMKNTTASNAKEEIPKGTETEAKNSTMKNQTQSVQSTEMGETGNSQNANSESENNAANNQPNATTTETNNTQSDTSSQNATQQSNQDVAFTIKSGDTSDSVAANLYKAGLIDNAQKFNQFIIKKGYDKNLRVGTYTVQKGDASNYEKILESIIK